MSINRINFQSASVDIDKEPENALWTAGVRRLMARDTENNLIFLESFKEQEAENG